MADPSQHKIPGSAPAAPLPTSVLRLLSHLNATQKPLPLDELVSLAQAPLTLRDVAPFVAFEAGERCRKVVHREAHYELVVIGWLPGQESEIHDHGRSSCAVRVLCGEAAELRFGRDGRRFAQRSYAAGGICAMGPGPLHQIANHGDAPLVTLHIYSPPIDTAPMRRGARDPERRIVVVGGGFSGAALAIHLARAAAGAMKISIVEPSARLGRGLAYDAQPWHLLNVPAGRLSVLPDDPDHFYRWAHARDTGVERGSFLPRVLYGDYIESVLAAMGPACEGVRQKVVDVVETRSRIDVALSSGAVLEAEAVALATGNALPRDPPELGAAVCASPRYVRWPLRPGALEVIDPDEKVLVIGTGLTMVDVMLSLEHLGHRGHVLALSRRGLRPAGHAPYGIRWTRPPFPEGARLAELLRRVRASMVAAAEAGIPWQAVMDSLRPVTQPLWRSLSAKDKQRFIRHLRPQWDVHRHRAAPEVMAALLAREARGALTVVAARLVGAELAGTQLAVTFRRRGEPSDETQVFHRVINSTGPEIDVARSEDRLLKTLVARGEIVQDPLKLGLMTDSRGAARRFDGSLHRRLYVVGPARRAELWEATAVPEIAQHAAKLARFLRGATLAVSEQPESSMYVAAGI